LATWTTTELTDGPYALRLSARDRLGHTSRDSLTVIVDNTPPTARFTRLDPDAVLSGNTPLFGSLADARLQSYILSYAHVPGLSLAALTDTLWQVIRNTTSSGLKNELLANWDSSNETGPILLRLEATDQAGNRTLATDQIITLENLGALPQVQLSAPAANAVVSGTLSIEGTAVDDNFERYTLRILDTNGSATPIATAEASRSNTSLGLLDTRSLNEGPHTIELVATNRDGYTQQAQLPITIDHTPPEGRIEFPAFGARLSGQIIITGTAQDAHFRSYKLAFGPGLDPAPEQLIQLGALRLEGIDNDILASWDTPKENGTYTLILTVEDQAGLINTVRQRIEVDNIPPGILYRLQEYSHKTSCPSV
jgi:hypothetical protein